MIRRPIWFAVAFVSAFTLTALAQTNTPIPLPADPSTVIVTLDWHGYWQDLNRKNPQPDLMIRADGSISVADPRGIWPDIQGRLSAAELQDFLRFIVRDQDFFALDAPDIRRKVELEAARTNSGTTISDAGEPVIRVKTAENDKEIRYYALDFYAMRYPADRFPSLKALGQLHAVQARLQRLTEEVRGGGKDAINRALADANAYLRRERPEAPLFTADNYLRTLLNGDGLSKHFQFTREIAGGASNSVTVQYGPSSQPEFRFTVYQPRSALFPVTPRN
jgi:hypothetical protein